MMRKHKTYARGDARAQELRMTDANVTELRYRRACGEGSAALVSEFVDRCGVSRAYIYAILSGQRRKDDAALPQGESS